MKVLISFFVLIVNLGVLFSQAPVIKSIKAKGAEFHYVEKGGDEPVILLHGGIGDLRSWDSQVAEFSKSFRVISYSRRFHYPNQNPPPRKSFSVFTEADDLYHLMRALKIRRAHLVGASIGAFVALAFAIEHPEMVSSLVLGEPPLHQLVRSRPGGEEIYKSFLTDLGPVKDAFLQGDDRDAMGKFLGVMGRKMDSLPPKAVANIMQNARAVREISLATEPFPAITRGKLAKLKIPVLIVTGEETVRIHRIVDEQLVLMIPKSRHVLISKSGHGAQVENPSEYNAAVLTFLSQVRSVKN